MFIYRPPIQYKDQTGNTEANGPCVVKLKMKKHKIKNIEDDIEKKMAIPSSLSPTKQPSLN